MENPWIVSVLVGAVVLIAGLLATWVANHWSFQQGQQDEVLKQAVEASRQYSDGVERLAKKMIDQLPQGAERDRTLQILRTGPFTVAEERRANDSPRADFVEALVTQYHRQALSQARAQFWFSVAAAAAGFAYIIYTSVTSSGETWDTMIKTLPGVIINAVSLLFFGQAEKTRQRATALYDRLRADSKYPLATEVLNQMEASPTKATAQAQIALHLFGVPVQDADLSGSQPPPAPGG